MSDLAVVDVSICIVSNNTLHYLRGCLQSIAEHPPALAAEIIITDNGSTDGTQAMLQSEFPAVQLIQNTQDEGFTRPTNQAMRQAVGRYVLLLNPDTIIFPGAIDTLVQFMEGHPQVGICGPKVLNRDGTLQKPCRRGVARPWAAFAYHTGLAKLFPKSKFFNGYLLTHLDEDETNPVDGVSGSCMLIRRAVIDQIGYFDERYFAYQEDADYCFQAQKAGWQIYYVPAARITHYGGQGGSLHRPYRAIYEWHRSYYLYYRKNLARDYFFLFNGFYYALMGLRLLLALLFNLLRKRKSAGPSRG